MLKELKKLSDGKAIRSIVDCVVIVVGIIAALWYLGLSQVFTKPIYLNEVADNEIAPGRAELDLNFIVDSYASYESNGSITKKYYLIPIGEESYMGIEAPKKYFDDFDSLMTICQEYMMGNRDSVEGNIHVTGTIAEMSGQELKYYKEYYNELGWGGEEIFLPYSLKLDHYGSVTMVEIVVAGIFALCFLIGISVMLVKVLNGKYVKMITDYCKMSPNYEQTLQKIEQFYYSTAPIMGFRISEEYVMVVDGANIRFFEGKDLLWAYMNVTKHYTYFIKIGTSYSINLCMKNGMKYIISMKSEVAAQEILHRFNVKLPFVFTGYSKELEHFYNKNRTEMIMESEKIRMELIGSEQEC